MDRQLILVGKKMMLTVVLAWAVGSVQAQETKETLTLTLDKALEIALSDNPTIKVAEEEIALKKGDYKNSVKEQPGSSAVVQGISSDEQGIGYSGIGYVTSGVKTLSLAEKSGKAAVQPSYDNCINGTYPLSRYLLIYVNKKPGEPLDTLTREFIKFIVSKDGQEIVTKDGYYPIPAKVSAEVLKSIE